MTAEHQRIKQAQEGLADWKRWGPYVSQRQWGTVREDYNPPPRGEVPAKYPI